MSELWVLAQKVITVGIVVSLLEMLLPEGKIKKTALLACGILTVSVVLGGITAMPDIEWRSAVSDDSSQENYEKRIATQIKNLIRNMDGFTDCSVYVESDKSDTIFRVTGIVIYCKGAKEEGEETVRERLSMMYQLERERVRITR